MQPLWSLENTQALLVAVQGSGKDYHASVTAAGKKHGLGSPHKYAASKLIQTLYESPSISPEDKQILRMFSQAYPTVADVERAIPVLRLSITFEKSSVS